MFPFTSCAQTGSLQDQLRDFIRLRNKGQVTRFNLYSLGTHALGHESLEVRIDRAVLGRNGVIARLWSPSRVRGLAGEQRLVERLLDRVEHLGLRLRQVAR